MRILLLFVILTSLSCISTPQKREPNNLSAPALTLEALKNLIELNQTTTVSETLAVLSSQYSDFMKRRALVYRSGSRQQASFKEPRVIVYGKDAKFVLTFNGGPHQPGGSAFETMVFNDQTNRFEFREILFKKELRPKSTYDKDEIEFESERIIIGKPNPYTCMECHGINQTGPIWANNFLWPGVYGSNDDILFGSFKKQSYIKHGAYIYLKDLKYPRSQGRWIDLGPKTEDLELRGYLEYLTNAKVHPRYKHLPELSYERGFRKYAAGTPFEEIDDEAAINAESQELGVSAVDRPNMELTDRLMELTWKNLVADIEKVPRLQQDLKKLLSVTLHRYPFFWGSERDIFFEPLPKEMNSPAQQKFLNSVLRGELAIQRKKIEDMEKDFGGEIITHPQWTQIHNDSLEPIIKKYSKLLGRKLTRTEIVGLDGECGSLTEFAQFGYILKKAKFDFGDYDINRERLINFHVSFGIYPELVKKFTGKNDLIQPAGTY